MDASLYRGLNRFAARTGWAHWVFVGVAKYGIMLFAVALLVGWWQARQADSPDAVVAVGWAGLGSLVALGIGQLIGNVVDRARPYDTMPTAHVLTSRTSDFSFPSDHATAAGAVAAGLLIVGHLIRRPLLGWIALALAVAMAFSRVYVGAHYPGDVLAGLTLGGVVVAAGYPIVRWLLVPLARRLVPTPVGVLIAHNRAPAVR